MRFLFLNQYFPPDPAPTGILLRELGEALEARGHEVRYVAAGQNYRSGQSRGGRLMREARGLLALVQEGWRGARPHVVLSLTSPPMLLVIATLLAWRHRARSVHWIMDLYPELVPALGKLPAHWMVWPLQWLMRLCYRYAALTVVLDEDMAEVLRANYGVRTPIIAPWVFRTLLPSVERALAEPPEPAVPPRWIYSGNLGLAHEWQTLLDAQKLLEQRGSPVELIFQGGGPRRAEAKAYAEEIGLRQCRWFGYAEEEELTRELLKAYAVVATQRLAARGLLWPSKLGLLQCLPRAIGWVGDPAGGIAAKLRARLGSGVFGVGESAALADWVERTCATAPSVPKEALVDARETREAALAEWVRRLEEFGAAGE